MTATAHSFGKPLSSGMTQITKQSDRDSGGHTVATERHSTSHSKSKTQQCMQEVMNIHLLVALHVNECIQLSHQHVIGITT